MRAPLALAPSPAVRLRPAALGDLGALLDLERRVFTTDRLSRRSLRDFLFRPNHAAARLYSIAVEPGQRGGGIGPMLLDAAEDKALAHDCVWMRLEVHENNARAIRRYK